MRINSYIYRITLTLLWILGGAKFYFRTCTKWIVMQGEPAFEHDFLIMGMTIASVALLIFITWDKDIFYNKSNSY